jgi:hypothetical protein
MPCPAICPREQMRRDPDSLGPVGDEPIHRGFFPADRAAGTIKRNAIRAKHLWDGQLSVWRACQTVNTTVEELVAFIEPLMVLGNGERFDELKQIPSQLIRSHQVDGTNERSFSILDECVYDRQGHKHPAHAHIAICEHLKAKITFKDETFFALQEGLKLLFEHGGTVWTRTTAV